MIMQALKTFLAGTFLGAAGLGALVSALGLNAHLIALPAPVILPALGLGDLIEVGGSLCVGMATALLLRHRRA